MAEDQPLGELREDSWPLGWIPSTSDVGNLTPGQHGLVRMDNLTLDETGTLRLSRGFTRESAQVFNDVMAVFSASLPGLGKFKYVYTQGLRINPFTTTGSLYKNVAFTNVAQQNPYDLVGLLFSGIPYARAAFLAVLGRVFICIGANQFEDVGTSVYPLGLIAPAAPVVVANSNPTKDLDNLNAGTYANWTSIQSGSFNNSADVDGTTANVNGFIEFIAQTIYSSPVDTTDLSGTGHDTPDDIFGFDFMIDDAAQLWGINLRFYAGTPSGSSNVNSGFIEWDYPNNLGLPLDPNITTFPVSSGVMTRFTFKRSEVLGTENATPAWNWAAVKAVRLEVRVISGATITFKNFTVQGGKLSTITDSLSYLSVQVRDDGNFLEFSPAGAVATVNLTAGNATITPPALVASANRWFLFRKDSVTGEYLRVTDQKGAFGFTPTPFVDGRASVDLVSDAAENPYYTLQFFRTTLPTNIIDMIWFRDRMIYLTPTGFIPSFLLDPGSYDSRFTYELAGGGGNAETCLFICKLDVGNFIVATTRDFYRVTGKFSLQQDPLTGINLLDVNIYPLSISDPAISHAFCEVNGSIVYLSSTGIRTLTNFVSTLINDQLDLLFRGESRYDLSPVRLAPNDLSQVAMVAQGKRVIVSLPHQDGVNRVYVLTLETSGYNVLNYSRSWRLWTMGDLGDNPTAMCRAEDGTVYFAGYASPTNYLKSFETNFQLLPVKLRTVYNYGNDPNTRKDALTLKMALNTNNNPANIAVYGIGYDGNISKVLLQAIALGNTVLEIDLKTLDPANNSLGPSLAYAIEISCYTDYFELNYWSLIYKKRPPGTRRAIMFYNDFDKPGRKRIETWPFLVDPVTAANIITALVSVDGTLLPAQTFSGFNFPEVFQWMNALANGNFGQVWQIELVATDTMEVYKIETPVVIQQMPTKINYVIKPQTNFGKPTPKKIATWPIVCNPTGKVVTILVTIDGAAQPLQVITGSRIQTFYWHNTNDIKGVDWQMEVYCATPGDTMEFFEFLNPEVLQVFPMEKLIDQIGPLDLKSKGLVTGARFRLYTTTATLSYLVYDGDTQVLSDSIATTPGLDLVYNIPFPKGIDPAVLRVVLSATQIFYRFSLEFRVKLTGRDTEETFLKVTDTNV